jgi:hypothetical protein
MRAEHYALSASRRDAGNRYSVADPKQVCRNAGPLQVRKGTAELDRPDDGRSDRVLDIERKLRVGIAPGDVDELADELYTRVPPKLKLNGRVMGRTVVSYAE